MVVVCAEKRIRPQAHDSATLDRRRRARRQGEVPDSVQNFVGFSSKEWLRLVCRGFVTIESALGSRVTFRECV